MEFNELENSFVGFKQILRIPIKGNWKSLKKLTLTKRVEEEIPESSLVEKLSETGSSCQNRATQRPYPFYQEKPDKNRADPPLRHTFRHTLH